MVSCYSKNSSGIIFLWDFPFKNRDEAATMKDNFSTQSDQYAKYRPVYPEAFFDYLNSIVTSKKSAWDCGTGNGQVARELAKTFDNVEGSDISSQQLENAFCADNIHYSVQSAENTDFAADQFDLITVAQAIHWFDFDKFYAEVRRTAKDNALLVVMGYGRVEVSETIDRLVTDFYTNVIGPYWDKERRYIDDLYQTIPFPFQEIETPIFANTQAWTLAHFVGYLNTWSAVKHYIKHNHCNPVDELQVQLQRYWSLDEVKEVSFPLLLRIGQVNG